MKIKLVTILIGVFCFTCQQKPEQQDTVQEQQVAAQEKVTSYPDVLEQALNAHGGIEKWKTFGTLEYNMQKPDFNEYQLIDLKTRKTLLITDKYKLGFDGEQAWITPSKEVFGRSSIRFYHNLYFYFFAFPFVLADDGVNYEVLPQEKVEGTTYDVLRIGYGDSVGDSPDDNYICYFDQDSHQLAFIRYTVTYFSKEKSEKYNALKYTEWQEVNGLRVPKTMDSYKWENGTFGEKRGSTFFEDVVFSESQPINSVFEMPSDAETDATKS